MELKFEKKIGFCFSVIFEWLPKCRCKKSMSQVWVEELSDTGYLLSAITQHLSSSAQPNYTDQDCQVHSGLDCGQLSRHQTLDPGFSGSKTAGTRAGAAPDSGVTMVIMNTRAGEEREARSV